MTNNFGLTRRQLLGITPLLAFASRTSAAAQGVPEPSINSSRFIVSNADSGAVYAERNADKQVAIASLTKVFSAMQAINMAPLDTVITTVSDDMQPADATIMGFGPGETFTLEELIYGMMLESGNDAAVAVARSLGYKQGDTAEQAVARFVNLINERVRALGLNNTHLINPDGWGVEGHYSTAADVAAFMAYASTNDFLMKVMGTKQYTTTAGYHLTNTNKVLSSSPSVYAGKTGYDDDAGWCLVQIARRKDARIIAVTLDGFAPDDWYNDNLLLLDYGFDRQQEMGQSTDTGRTLVWNDPAPALFQAAAQPAKAIAGMAPDSLSTISDAPEPLDDEPIFASSEDDMVASSDSSSASRFTGRPALLAAGGAGTVAAIIALYRRRTQSAPMPPLEELREESDEVDISDATEFHEELAEDEPTQPDPVEDSFLPDLDVILGAEEFAGDFDDYEDFEITEVEDIDDDIAMNEDEE